MKPTLIIDQEVYNEIMFYVNRSEFEVSGMGKVVVEPGGILRVVSQFMLPQKNRTTHTQVEPEDINKLLYQLGESPRFWWHSHVKMGVFWSGEDMSTIKENAGPEGWFINTVFNQKREMKTAYYAAKGIYTPYGNYPLFHDDCPTEIRSPKELEEIWAANYEANCTNVSYSYSHHDWQKRQAATAAGGNTAGESRAPGETRVLGLATNNTTHGSNATTIDFTKQPPDEKPPTMKKKTYKHWVQAWNKQVKNAALAVIHKDDGGDLDGFGFTPEEKKILEEAKYTENWVEALFEEDFTPSEIVMLARFGQTIQDVRYYLSTKMLPEQIIESLERAHAMLEDHKTTSDEPDHHATECFV